MPLKRWMLIGMWLISGWADRCLAVIFLATDDVQHNTTPPGDNSGWQYEGKFIGFLGVPIAPNFFITAQHIGGNPGDGFDFHGDIYTTIAVHDCPASDLRIWEVDHGKPFPTYAPLSSGVADVGATAAIFGRGTRRGAQIVVGGEAKGWLWGVGDGVERWGRNTVAQTVSSAGLGEFLSCDFDNPGLADECHLSVGDSGGGMFVLENGLWRLAGIHYSVDGPFRIGTLGSPFNAALFDAGGLDYLVDETQQLWISLPDLAQNNPSSFYSSRIAAVLPWITSVASEAASLAQENFSAWQRLYFTPAQIAEPAITGPMADFDGDGISNLLEFALNLDPTFREIAAMEPGTGLRGLPALSLATVDGNTRLTLEFVRRTSTSGAGLTYTPQFSSDLLDWQSGGGTETVTPINPRWERVKVVDFLSTLEAPKRFARLCVTLAE